MDHCQSLPLHSQCFIFYLTEILFEFHHIFIESTRIYQTLLLFLDTFSACLLVLYNSPTQLTLTAQVLTLVAVVCNSHQGFLAWQPHNAHLKQSFDDTRLSRETLTKKTLRSLISWFQAQEPRKHEMFGSKSSASLRKTFVDIIDITLVSYY